MRIRHSSLEKNIIRQQNVARMSEMPRKILVVGFQVYDAGKTTLCKALIHGFKKAGLTLCRSSHTPG